MDFVRDSLNVLTLLSLIDLNDKCSVEISKQKTYPRQLNNENSAIPSNVHVSSENDTCINLTIQSASSFKLKI